MLQNHPLNKRLQKSLLLMMKRDQRARVRGSWTPEIDAENTRKLKNVIARYGWPTNSLVGEDGARAAWLIAQHTPDVSFQKKCLPLLRKAVRLGQASKSHLAFLTDKMRVREGKKQIFGTQFKFDARKKRLLPWLIEDRSGVNRRRKRYGLEPFEAYRKKMGKGDLRKYRKLTRKFSKISSPKS